MHRRHPLALLLLAACAAACTPRGADRADASPGTSATPADETARRTARADAADVRAPLVAIDEPRTPATRAEAPTPSPGAGEWFLQESDPPTAVWGVPAGEGMLSIGCDRAGRQVTLARQAIGVPDDVRIVVLDADGVRMDYPAERRETELAPMLATHIALDAPILDRLLTARRMVVTAGDDAIATTAPGASLRAVVDACRREPTA